VCDETVNRFSLDATQLTLRSANDSSAVQWYTLSNKSSLASGQNSNIPTVVVALADDDVNEIMRLHMLASTKYNTFLSITSLALQDTAIVPNDITSIPTSSALPVTNYTGDYIDPSFVSVDLDLSNATGTLCFDETVNVSTFKQASCFIQNLPGADAPYVHQFEAITITSFNDVCFTFNIGIADLNKIFYIREIGTTHNNTYIRMLQGAITDMHSNPVLYNAGERVSEFKPDYVAPTLVSFNLSMDGDGLLTLNFSETMKVETLDVQQITLLSAQNGTGAASYQLTGGNFSKAHVDDSTVVEITLLKADLDAIKANIDLCDSIDTTYLAITNATIDDMNDNAVVAITTDDALKAFDFTEDITPPELVYFDFNMDIYNRTVEIFMLFSETVNASSFDVTQLTLQNNVVMDLGNDATYYQITRGGTHAVGTSHEVYSTNEISTSVTIVLSILDSDENNMDNPDK
jgi:hypothetical protein